MAGTILHPPDKTLVLGLGGTGKDALVQLKRRLLEEGYADTTEQPHLRLLCLDFDDAEERDWVTGDGRREVKLASTEFLALDGNRIQERLHNLRQPENCEFYQEWYPDLEGEVIAMGAYSAGAAQWRPLGRMGFFEHAERIQTALRRALRELLEGRERLRASQEVQGKSVYVISSVAGGTGAGIFWDVAYYMRTQAPDIKQIGLFLLPGVYRQYDVSGRLFANTYASLKELTVFANQGRPFVAKYGQGNTIQVAQHDRPPFDQILLYDNVLLPNEWTDDPKKMASVLAETVFFDLAETRVGEMGHSALTNLASLTGSHSQSKLDRQSVFATAGTLTLRLPDQEELSGFMSQRYLSGVFLPALKQAKRLLDGDQTVISQLASQGRSLFPELEGVLDQALNKSCQACLEAWGREVTRNLGRAMARGLAECLDDPDKAENYASQWLQGLYQPGEDGRFPLAPNWLPDVGEDGKSGPLIQARDALVAKLSESLASQRRGRTDRENADWLEGWFFFLWSQRLQLKSQADSAAKGLATLVNSQAGVFDRLKSDLREFAGEKPWPEVARPGAAHWARRLLREVRSIYEKSIYPLRAAWLLSLALEKFCEENIIATSYLHAMINHLDEIVRRVNQRQQAFVDQQARSNQVVVRNLADQAFWEQYWRGREQTLPQRGGLMGFILRLKALEQSPDGLSVEQMMGEVLNLAREETAGALTEDQEGPDLHDLVDPGERAKSLARAQHNYFFTNRFRRGSEHDKVFAAAPQYSLDSARGGPIFRRLKGELGQALEANTIDLRTYSLVDGNGDRRPAKLLVRHLSLNHPAANLVQIAEYYDAYAQYGPQKKLFHAHGSYAELDEVVDDFHQLKFTTCGNPGCTHDITKLDRGQIMCPGCGRPIRTRCGNAQCQEDHLDARPTLRGDQPPRNCPACGEPLRTYWWYCKEHNDYLRTDEDYCIKCLEEYEAGERPWHKVSARDGVDPYRLCPGCLCEGRKAPYQIRFLEVYDQVPEGKVQRAWEVYNQDTRSGDCPICGAQLLPICPQVDRSASESHIHFVRRLDQGERCQNLPERAVELGEIPRGLFFCTVDQEHAKKTIYECSYCHLPLREHATHCPRCKRKLILGPVEDTLASQIERERVETLLEEHHLERENQLPDELRQEVKRAAREEAKALAPLVEERILHHRWLWFGLSPEERPLLMRDGHLPAKTSVKEGGASPASPLLPEPPAPDTPPDQGPPPSGSEQAASSGEPQPGPPPGEPDQGPPPEEPAPPAPPAAAQDEATLLSRAEEAMNQEWREQTQPDEPA